MGSQLEMAKMIISSLSLKDRATLMKELNPSPRSAPVECRLIRRREVARLLSCHPRSVDNFADEGLLTRVKLPGRKNAQGFRLAEVQQLIEGEKK